MTIALAIITTFSLAVAICAVALTRSALTAAARDRAGDRATIDMLCQRIQAPQAAVAEHASRDAEPDRPHVSMFVDEEWHKQREEQAWQH